jgi:hypothetical protein
MDLDKIKVTDEEEGLDRWEAEEVVRVEIEVVVVWVVEEVVEEAGPRMEIGEVRPGDVGAEEEACFWVVVEEDEAVVADRVHH